MFLRYCLFTTTDQLILMVQRRIADLWRQAAPMSPLPSIGPQCTKRCSANLLP